MNNITDVVKKIIIVNVGIYILAISLPAYIPRLAMFSPFVEGSPFKPYQLVTHMFMHGSPAHLMFNMLTLFFLGPYVERALGAKKFVILYFVAGFAAMTAHFIINANSTIPVVGASGAINGVMIAFIVMFPDVKLMLLIPPIPIKAKYLAVGLIAYDLILGFRGGTGIAHFAHLGGALAGFILIQIWRKSNFRS